MGPLSLRAVVVKRRGWRLGPITWSVEPGVTALIGENGAGKSTLLRAASGHVRVAEGHVTRGRIGYLPQHVDFPHGVTARQMTEYAAAMAGSEGQMARVCDEALEDVGLIDRSDARARSLSGGQQRRLALAQLMTGSPDVLLLDEPFTGVDPIQRASMLTWIHKAASVVPCVVATHDLDAVAEAADRIVHMRGGQIVRDDEVKGRRLWAEDVLNLLRSEGET